MMLCYAVASGYFLTSTLLYFYPQILHRTKQIPFAYRTMAHRGGGGERTENTMVAFKHAQTLGVDLFELDVQMTSDGEIIVCHDDDLSRVCGILTKISSLPYADLPPLLKEIEVACEPGDFLRTEKQEPLLRLEDLYKEFPEVPMQIDVKFGGLPLLKEVSRLTEEYHREHLTVWGAFSHRRTESCRAYNPKMLTFCSMFECGIYGFLLLVGLLPFVPIKAHFYQIPIPNISNKSGFLSTWPVWFCHLITPIMCNRWLLWHLHRRGIATGAWVMNHPNEFSKADHFGFSGIMTDYPSRLMKYEEERSASTK